MDWEDETYTRMARVYAIEDIDGHMTEVANGIISMLDAVMSVPEWDMGRATTDALIAAYVRSYIALHPPT